MFTKKESLREIAQHKKKISNNFILALVHFYVRDFSLFLSCLLEENKYFLVVKFPIIGSTIEITEYVTYLVAWS